MKTSHYTVLQTTRRILKEVELLQTKIPDGSNKASASCAKSIAALRELEKSVSVEVNKRRKLREVYEAKLRALESE